MIYKNRAACGENNRLLQSKCQNETNVRMEQVSERNEWQNEAKGRMKRMTE